jgi:hypothetical protein
VGGGKDAGRSGDPLAEDLNSSMEQIYRTTKPALRDGLCEAFLAAEYAYLRYLPATFRGTISMEPLVSSRPGAPVYLSKRLTAMQRSEYAANLSGVRTRFAALEKEVPEKRHIPFILRAIENMQRDISALS